MYKLPVKGQLIEATVPFKISVGTWYNDTLKHDYIIQPGTDLADIPPGTVAKLIQTDTHGKVKVGIFKKDNPANLQSHRLRLSIEEFNSAEWKDH